MIDVLSARLLFKNPLSSREKDYAKISPDCYNFYHRRGSFGRANFRQAVNRTALVRFSGQSFRRGFQTRNARKRSWCAPKT
jgi:hypothetical protein